MDPCVTCGTTEETTSVCTCDCQCLETARRSGCREIKLIAPTRDTATAWAENDPIVPEGVFFLVKDRLFEGSLEYAIGDGESKYSELSMLYAGAPLSRTGAANHSPLAASGKSTLDPSWLPAATSSTLGAVMVSTTGAADKVPIAASDSNSLDISWFPTSTTGAAGKIPIPASGQTALDPSWLPDATSSTKGAVMASTTTAANNVVKADANGSLAGWSDALSAALVNSDGGLTVDPNTNKLMVDFSMMPTDKFEALLKGLKMQIPLEANLNLYVDKNSAAAADTIEDGRGTQVKPFKTIQAAVNFVTQTYAVGPYSVYIYIAEATYTENVRLPIYTRTSGGISLRALDNDHPPTITNNGAATTVLAATGGNWGLLRLNITGVFSDVGDGFIHTPSVVNANNSGTTLSIVGCNLSCSYEGAAPTNGGYYNPHIISATQGGVITLDVLAGYHNTITAAKGNAQVLVALYAERNAQIIMPSSNTTDDSIMYNIPCSGTVSTFASCIANSLISIRAGGANFQKFTGTVTGNKYSITNSSGIDAPEDGFPGSVDSTNTVESATYCWYKERT